MFSNKTSWYPAQIQPPYIQGHEIIVPVSTLPQWADVPPAEIHVISGTLLFNSTEDLPQYRDALRSGNFPQPLLRKEDFPQPLESFITEAQRFLTKIYQAWGLKQMWHWLLTEPDLWEFADGFYRVWGHLFGDDEATRNYTDGLI